jgi:hypothetical protein
LPGKISFIDYALIVARHSIDSSTTLSLCEAALLPDCFGFIKPIPGFEHSYHGGPAGVVLSPQSGRDRFAICSTLSVAESFSVFTMGATSTTSPTHDELAASACYERFCPSIINTESNAAYGCGKHFDL